MAALTQPSQKAISDIIKEMTRPITEILGEPPLTPLDARPRKRPLPMPLRARDASSDADIIAITSYYKGPEPFLEGGRVTADLCPARKRPRVDRVERVDHTPTSAESLGKKRRREEKPPRPENSAKKREDSTKKARTEDVKPRPAGIKLTSQPAPRETNNDTGKKPRLSSAASARKKEEHVRESDRETKKRVNKELDDETKKESTKAKDTSRKRPSPVLRIPASVIPRSQPRPVKTSSPEESGSEADRHKPKAKKTESAAKRLSIPRVPASEAVERHRRDETTRPAANESPGCSASSSERRRPRARQLNGDSVRHRDRDYDTDRDLARQDKGRNRERDRDWESDRDRADRGRDGLRRSSARADREKEADKAARERKKERRDRDHGDGDRERENGKRDDDMDRVKANRPKDRVSDHKRDRERPSLRRSLPSSRPEPARESSPAGHSPRDSRTVSLSSKQVNRSGPSQSPPGENVGDKSTRPRHGRAELKQNLAKQKELKKKIRSMLSRIEELLKKKDYNGYEEAAKQGFRLSFDLGLAMETELRLAGSTFRTMSATERSARKQTIINHYKSLTKTYVPKRTKELEEIGRKEAASFYKRGIQKVYFRMFNVYNLWDKDVQHSNDSLRRLLTDAVTARNAGGASRPAEEEIPTRKLKMLSRLVDDHINILSILEGIVMDVGSGFEEAGAEGYIP